MKLFLFAITTFLLHACYGDETDIYEIGIEGGVYTFAADETVVLTKAIGVKTGKTLEIIGGTFVKNHHNYRHFVINDEATLILRGTTLVVVDTAPTDSSLLNSGALSVGPDETFKGYDVTFKNLRTNSTSGKGAAFAMFGNNAGPSTAECHRCIFDNVTSPDADGSIIYVQNGNGKHLILNGPIVLNNQTDSSTWFGPGSSLGCDDELNGMAVGTHSCGTGVSCAFSDTTGILCGLCDMGTCNRLSDGQWENAPKAGAEGNENCRTMWTDNCASASTGGSCGLQI